MILKGWAVKRPSLSKYILGMRCRLVTAIVLFLSLCKVSAQDYKPTTTWPYLYPDFISGELKKHSGVAVEGTYNVHLSKGTLHFIEKDLIREASVLEVFSVRIGKDYYANVGGAMMKVLAQSDNGFVAQEILADFAALNNTGGAYGSSSNSISTQALSSMEGIGGTRSNMNHMELKNAKDSGELLPLTTKLYLVLPGKVIYAAKKDVSDIEGIDKKELAAFLKENKIKWKDPQSLLVLVDYVSSKLNE